MINVLGGGFRFPNELHTLLWIVLAVAISTTLVAGRSEPDPTNVRTLGRYLAAMSLLTLFVSIFAIFGAVHALTDMMVDHSDRARQTRADDQGSFALLGYSSGVDLPVPSPIFDFSGERNLDANVSAAVASALVASTTGGLFVFHRRWRRRVMRGDRLRNGPLARVDRAYHYGACFVSGLILAFAYTGAGFAVFQIAAPSTAIGGDADVGRMEGVSELIAFVVLIGLAFAVFRGCWRHLRTTDALPQYGTRRTTESPEVTAESVSWAPEPPPPA